MCKFLLLLFAINPSKGTGTNANRSGCHAWPQVLSLQRLKEVLIPKALKPPPPEMQPFEPKDGEPMRVSATQVRPRCLLGSTYVAVPDEVNGRSGP